MSALKQTRPRLDAQQVSLVMFLAHTYLEYDFPAKANALLHALQVSGAANAQLYVLRAVALVRLNKPGQALDLLDEAALAGELLPGYHMIRAQALALVERRAEAAEAFRCFVEAIEANASRTPDTRPLRSRHISQE